MKDPVCEESEVRMTTVSILAIAAVSSAQEASAVSAQLASSMMNDSRVAYRPGFDQGEADVLVQLKANLAQLEDLHARLKFAMGEISYLIKRS